MDKKAFVREKNVSYDSLDKLYLNLFNRFIVLICTNMQHTFYNIPLDSQ